MNSPAETTNPTPGPWKADGLRVVDSNGNLIAECSATGRTPEEARANAELIAAAAQLMEAMRGMLSGVAKGRHGSAAQRELEKVLVDDTLDGITGRGK